MKLYDNIISRVTELLPAEPSCRWDFAPGDAWAQTKSSELVMQRDAAFELGGSGKPSANIACLTEDDSVVSKDEILLYGKDLGQLREDCAYARIALLSVEGMGEEGEELYRAIREIDFAKYRVFPEGFMMRTSPNSFQEQIRLDRRAVKKGISFRTVGNAFIAKYKENPAVRSVKLIFITDPSFDYEGLSGSAKAADGITAALSTIMKGLKTDCATCQLKGLCDEVEGMRELHFKHDSGK